MHADPPTIVLDESINVDQFSNSFTITPVINLGQPVTMTSWALNGESLDPSDSRISFSSRGPLTVNNVEASDRGVYTITASNSAVPDGVMASINVFIDCKSVYN